MEKNRDSSGANARERTLWIMASAFFLIAAVLAGATSLYLHRELDAARHGAKASGVLPPANAPAVLSPGEILRLQELGLADPVPALAQDLMRHPELIPYPGVLGGNMGFYSEDNIQILTPRWVLANFDDGHIDGYMLLEYAVAPGGKITWKPLASYLRE